MGKFWDWVMARKPENLVSIGSPEALSIFDVGPPSYAGVEINETTSLSLSAVYRAVALIAGTIGTLPLKTYRETDSGIRQQLTSVFDNPGREVGLVPFNWKETITAHLLLHGNAFLKRIYGGAGQVVSLLPVHPMLVSIELPRPGDPRQPVGGKWFRITAEDGTQRVYDAEDIVHVMGMSLNGYSGVSVISIARNSFGTAIAGDRAAAKTFSQGAMISGMVTPEDSDELEDTDPENIRRAIDNSVTGWENAGGIPVINRRLKFTPWTMTAADAQFLESRQFSVREIARWFGVPPHLLMETSAASNWGTGIEQQNLALGRFTLATWTGRIEETLSTVLTSTKWVEFEYAALERPNPETEIRLLIDQVAAGLLTLNEARAIRNLPPLDTPPTPAQQATDPQGAPSGTN